MGFEQFDAIPSNPAAQGMSGKQPLTGKMLPMVPKYKSKLLILRDANQQLIWPFPCVFNNANFSSLFKWGEQLERRM